MNKRNDLVPEALGQRPDLEHNKFALGSQPLGLDGVSIKFGTKTKPHIYNAPTGEGEVSRRLRRFALTLSRFQLPDAKKYIKRWGVSQTSLDAAVNIITTKAYQQAFADDPTIGTMDTSTLVSLLNEPNPPPELFSKALAYANTKAFSQILEGLEEGDVYDSLTNSAEILERFTRGWSWQRITNINHKDIYYRKHARGEYKRLAQYIDNQANGNAEAARTEVIQEVERPKGLGKHMPDYGGKEQGWYPIFLVKPDLERSHTGKLGRRNIYCETGRSVKNISRLYSDPEQRVFSRKTRSLGAVVVFDCSGSMSLDQDDFNNLMKASAGATVLCYSTGNNASEAEPNAWIVARKGRQVRQLPPFPGGNGCDGPALMLGLDLRAHSRQPVIWVSDGGVTGTYDVRDHNLEDQCNEIVRKNNIHWVKNVNEAVKLMSKLQGRQQ